MHSPKLTLTIAALAFVASTGSQAQRVLHHRDAPALTACLASPQSYTTPGQVGCAMEEEGRQSDRMQTALAATLATLPEDRRRDLMRVQDAWSHWLTARCDFIDGPFEGSQAKVEAALCRMDTIAERADELTALRRPAMLAPVDAPR